MLRPLLVRQRPRQRNDPGDRMDREGGLGVGEAEIDLPVDILISVLGVNFTNTLKFNNLTVTFSGRFMNL